jgi:hypothetical protein
MSYLIDDVARALATPMPRRKALRFVGSALAAGALGALGLGHAAAQTSNTPTKCPKGTTVCGKSCCSEGQSCCDNIVCCNQNQKCCTGSGTCCNQNQQCVNGRCTASKS